MPNSSAGIVGETTGRHGEIRGISVSLSPGRRPPQFEGRFGRMSWSMPALFDRQDLMKLGDAMTAGADDRPPPENGRDPNENPAISAGYTYLGQFLDHDLTFDPVSSFQRQSDPFGLTNYRTPRFDLDSVYGR